MKPHIARGFSAVDAQHGPSGGHKCHNCGRPLPAKYVMHPKAWFKVPSNLRTALWRSYKPDQEILKNPTQEYIEALEAVLQYCKENQVSC